MDVLNIFTFYARSEYPKDRKSCPTSIQIFGVLADFPAETSEKKTWFE